MRLERLALVLLLVLSACGAEKKEPTKGTAAGEVLEASVSDAMLPIDQVRSQAPLAPRTEDEGEKRGSRDDGAQEEDAGSTAAKAAPEGGQGATEAAPATPSAE